MSFFALQSFLDKKHRKSPSSSLPTSLGSYVTPGIFLLIFPFQGRGRGRGGGGGGAGGG